MKLSTNKKQYILFSGDEELTRKKTLKEICDSIGVSTVYVYESKKKDVNKDGSWSFNFQDYNYTIVKLNDSLPSLA